MDKRKGKWSKERKERWLASRWGGKVQKNNTNSSSPQDQDTTTPIDNATK